MFVKILMGALVLLIASMVLSIIQRRRHYKLKLISRRIYLLELVLMIFTILFSIGIGCIMVPYAYHHPNYLHEQPKL